MQKRRYIVHVDMDAFFASIEQRDNLSYRSRPVVVGADPKGGKGRGVVSTCSYEARRFGIRSAMPVSIAYRKCPHAVFLPVDMNKYEKVSSEVYSALSSFTPDIEPAGIDEAFLDITGSCHLFGRRESPVDTCRAIKSAIYERTRLTASVGLAPTMMAAKIASDLNKPDGLVEVSEEGLEAFLRPLEIRRIWGLGPKAEAALNAIGIHTIGEMADRSPEDLAAVLGRNGLRFRELARGVDSRMVSCGRESVSLSHEHTFDRDTDDRRIVEGAMMSMCEKVSERLRAGNLKCATVTVKIRLEPFTTHTRSFTAGRPTNFADSLYKTAKRLYNEFDRNGKRVRLIGVRASGIVPASSCGGLFDAEAESKSEEVHRAVDRIKALFGSASICRASSRSWRDPA